MCPSKPAHKTRGAAVGQQTAKTVKWNGMRCQASRKAVEQQMEQPETGIKCRFPVEEKKSRNQKWGFVRKRFAHGENRAKYIDFRGIMGCL